MPSVSEGIDQQKRRIKSPERINLPTLSLLTYLIGNNHLPPTKHPQTTQKKTRTIKEVLGMDENGDKAKTSQQ